MGAVGDDVLVSAPFHQIGGVTAGAAYLFDGSSGQFLQTYLNPNPNPKGWFGRGVGGLDNQVVLVSTPNDDTGGSNTGAAFMWAGPTVLNLTTDANGQYGSTELEPGTYRLRPVVEAGYEQTFPGGDG